ncbi:MAG: hypothetical protein IJA05_01895 [Oscillospiraceae bacterium]|nr:hypothetical protein [Oscillospiraceae bacterium]
MKKYIGIILVLACLMLLFSACSLGKTFSGETWIYMSNNRFVVVLNDNGKETGFFVTGRTETVDKNGNAITDLYEISLSKAEIVAGKKAEKPKETVFEDVDEWYYADKIKVLEKMEIAEPEKPVIYLYPEKETEVSVNLDFSGKLTSTYPEYNGGWKVTAKPDGTLFDENGKEYYCLFWEGISEAEYDFEKGFCVPGEKTAEFLEENLPKLGLSPKEANEFIIYWLPQMQENEYNLISFQSEAYTETAKLEIVPKPDTLIRVFMAWKPLDEFIEIEPQELSSPEREGFVAVEWGGAEIRQHVENFLQASEKRRVDPGIFGGNQE